MIFLYCILKNIVIGLNHRIHQKVSLPHIYEYMELVLSLTYPKAHKKGYSSCLSFMYFYYSQSIPSYFGPPLFAYVKFTSRETRKLRPILFNFDGPMKHHMAYLVSDSELACEYRPLGVGWLATQGQFRYLTKEFPQCGERIFCDP